MKKTILFGSLLAVFLMLMIPNVSALEYNEVKEKQEELIEKHCTNNIFNKNLVERLKQEVVGKQRLVELKNRISECFNLIDGKDTAGFIENLRVAIASLLAIPLVFITGIELMFGIMFLIFYYVVGILILITGALTGDYESFKNFNSQAKMFAETMFYPLHLLLACGLIIESTGEVTFDEAMDQTQSEFEEIIIAFLYKDPNVTSLFKTNSS